MRFAKGQSGNPGGRPRGHGDLRELARKHTLTALRTLAEIAERGENESARVAAANAILDRGWGKPTQHIDADLGGSLEHRISLMSPTERLTRLRELQTKATLALAIEGETEEVEVDRTRVLRYPRAER